MVNTNKLKGLIVENEMTQGEVAKKLGISPRTLYNKMQSGVFGSDEIEKLILLLNIEDPVAVFFTDVVA